MQNSHDPFMFSTLIQWVPLFKQMNNIFKIQENL
jgi:hypothetical protein